jgi:hypothetical protein
MTRISKQSKTPRWRVPFRKVRYGTKHEADDILKNQELAVWLTTDDALIDLVMKARTGLALRDREEAANRASEIFDDFVVALDISGWKIVRKDPIDDQKWPMTYHHDLCPEWGENPWGDDEEFEVVIGEAEDKPKPRPKLVIDNDVPEDEPPPSA